MCIFFEGEDAETRAGIGLDESPSLDKRPNQTGTIARGRSVAVRLEGGNINRRHRNRKLLALQRIGHRRPRRPWLAWRLAVRARERVFPFPCRA